MENLNQYHQIDVAIATHSYSIFFGLEILKDWELLKRQVHGSQVLIVTNQTVAPLYLSEVQKAFYDIQCDSIILPDGEKYKNQDSLCAIYDVLISNKHHRDTTIIALGGGVVGDLAGFAASTYQRGVGLIYIPTTLLAQVDAAIGGKTGINHQAGKNLVGCFYHPQAVLIDIATLKTLPKRELLAGFAEIIKYGLLVGGKFYDQLIKNSKKILALDLDFLLPCIRACCQIKLSFVVADDKEKGIRALLNLGHTFAHALETLTNFQRWLHGEAVAIGLYCAAMLSYKVNNLSLKNIQILESLLETVGLFYKIPADIDLEFLFNCMKMDKKTKNDRLTFVLIQSAGNCYLYNEIKKSLLMEVLSLCQDK